MLLLAILFLGDLVLGFTPKEEASIVKKNLKATIEDVPGVIGASSEVMQEIMVFEHERTLRAIRDARREVEATYADRIHELENELARELTSIPAVSADQILSKKRDDHTTKKKLVPPSQELNFLEYRDVPVNVFSKKDPLEASVMSVERIIGEDAPGAICQIVLHTQGKLPYVEGQSISVLPPGLDPIKEKPYQPRLYSIASSRYGDDGAGTSVSLCVRRAVYVDPSTGLEDPNKKGVCSNFLCDAKFGDKVQIAGPIGKAMLLPDDESADIIMVATGTGVAPFRGFVTRLFAERTPGAAAFTGHCQLFLGVPTTSSLLYPELWEHAETTKPDQFKATFAISREQTNPVTGQGKCYVQHRLAQYADDIFKRLEHGAHIYFCGLKGMMPEIEQTLEQACNERSLDFKAWVKSLKKEGRWHVEVY